ncbi:Crp/Fnr family transcriptional regulator [Undibacterium sp. TS12]|uniref:Crp/Fnr family transcriptional regulator n=1 Tax=Undibacterium sp. TS12 TaxID=2908202 RepID=UPI001F4CB4BC|nr:Crp/Fnr family transcriptional regulator [Undibacterium sp. TS12]MCH8621374.1 Crp/Fnr family transcriptional regulator [Undibacterium sp. TS12]
MDTSTFRSQHILSTLAGEALPGWTQVAADIRTMTLKAQDWVFHHDEIHPYLYVVVRGCVKLLYVQEDGKEWIKSFSSENHIFASMAALEDRGRTSFAVQTVTDTVLERLPFKALLQQAEQHPVWEKALRRGFQAFAARKEKRERELLTLSAAQRYHAVLSEEPDLVNRVSQKDLASYLGVTPVGLNRIIRRSMVA